MPDQPLSKDELEAISAFAMTGSLSPKGRRLVKRIFASHEYFRKAIVDAHPVAFGACPFCKSRYRAGKTETEIHDTSCVYIAARRLDATED